MIAPDQGTFLKLARRANLIPVYREFLADLETPVSVYAKLAQGPYSYLLESVEQGARLARYSFLGFGAKLVFKSRGRSIEIEEGGRVRRFTTSDDPLAEMKRLLARFRFAPLASLPIFQGGFVGYLGYDMVRFIERIPDENPDDLGLPDAWFILSDTAAVFDHLTQTVKLIVFVDVGSDRSKGLGRQALLRKYREALRRIDALRARLARPAAGLGRGAPSGRRARLAPQSNFTPRQFAGIVRKAKGYIRAGDIIQVVLSQRFELPLRSEPLRVYRALRSINPSPYMFLLRFGKLSLVGSSPEILVRCEKGLAEVRPIAGTRPRGETELEDLKWERELLADRKERAEHLMLVDLGRNDLGRVCRYGTVRVPEQFVVERYSHVMHLVSDCVGELQPKKDSFDALRACFPAGTVTGAPKIRAMEIIDELENIRRGPYAGCVGYMSFNGNLDTCITIRTILIKGKRAYVQAGAGIVADSVPAREYQETVNKAKALVAAIQAAEAGLE